MALPTSIQDLIYPRCPARLRSRRSRAAASPSLTELIRSLLPLAMLIQIGSYITYKRIAAAMDFSASKVTHSPSFILGKLGISD